MNLSMDSREEVVTDLVETAKVALDCLTQEEIIHLIRERLQQDPMFEKMLLS